MAAPCPPSANRAVGCGLYVAFGQIELPQHPGDRISKYSLNLDSGPCRSRTPHPRYKGKGAGGGIERPQERDRCFGKWYSH